MSERNSGKFRFWHDERRFKGGIEKCLVQQALFAAGVHMEGMRLMQLTMISFVTAPA